MTTRHLIRTAPLALAAAAALAGTVAALSFAGGHDALAHGAQAEEARTVPPRAVLTREEAAFRADLRRLWEDHVTWTRLAVISLTTGSPDTSATVGRLLRNQDDIGDAFAAFYGRAAGDELTAELRSHILIAADLIAAALAGDGEAVAAEQERWERNADDLAALLNGLNPRFWKLDVLRAELGEHLRLTTDEVLARLAGDWEADVAAYDAIHLHALHLSDVLSDGVVAQFPERFRPGGGPR